MNRSDMMLGLASSVIAPTLLSSGSKIADHKIALEAALLRPDTLAFHAARSGILFGTMIAREIVHDADYVEVVTRECSLVCPALIGTNITRRSSAGFDFKLGDQQIAFANNNDLAKYGGYLVVHGSEPPWITSTTDRETALAEMKTIINTTMKRYSKQLDYWIVVNEAVWSRGLRDCVWLSTIGREYVAEAFRTARLADASAMLVLNEGHLEEKDAGKTRAAILSLLASLVGSGVPVDALGMQAHLRPENLIEASELEHFLDSVHGLGVKIAITELDVNDADLAPDIGARDLIVAKALTNFLVPTLRHPAVTSVSVWGLSDRYSWYNRSMTSQKLRREDGLPSRATLLDRTLRRKRSYFAVRDALDGAPVR